MLRTIVLHGALAEEFGASFRLDIASPAEAVRALMTQLKGFRQRLRDGHYRVTRSLPLRDPIELGEDMLRFPLGRAEALHIVPVVTGAGGPSRGASTGKVIAGAVLVAVAAAAFILAPAGAGVVTVLGVSAFAVGAAGVAIGISGIAGLLTKAPQGGSESFLFGGQTNVTTQGGPVPLPYGGPIMTGSVCISAGLFTEALVVGTAPFDPQVTAKTSVFQSE